MLVRGNTVGDRVLVCDPPFIVDDGVEHDIWGLDFGVLGGGGLGVGLRGRGVGGGGLGE